jgi:RND family efflux transporter MFP subunit
MYCLLAALMWTACAPGASDPGANEGEEEKTAQITVWGERFEIFLEHQFIVAGVPTGFITHVTDLKTLEPRREGKVAFVLRQGSDAPIEHVEDEPKRAGIYIPELTFPKPGTWTVALRIPIDGAESVVELPAFTVWATKKEAKHAPEPEAPEGISFLKEQQWKVLTATAPVQRRELTERVRVPAVVASPPGSKAAATPPIAGRLLAPPGKTLPSLGERVEAGQVLALVQPPFSDFAAKWVEANAEAIRARLALDQAELAHARVKKLAAGQAKTEREVQESEFTLKAAQAAHQAALALKTTYERAGAVLSQEGLPVLEIRSPIAGIVTQVGATIGEYVPTDRALFAVLDTARVLVEARTPEADVARLGAARAALAEIPDERGKYFSLLERGKLLLLSPEVNPSTRTVGLVYEVENPDGRLRIGAALTLHLETARAEDALAVPASALVDEEGRAVAFVQVSGETFQKRFPRLGVRDGPWVQVLDDLAEGERVVTKEAFAIRLASVSSVIPAHGHAH